VEVFGPNLTRFELIDVGPFDMSLLVPCYKLEHPSIINSIINSADVNAASRYSVSPLTKTKNERKRLKTIFKKKMKRKRNASKIPKRKIYDIILFSNSFLTEGYKIF